MRGRGVIGTGRLWLRPWREDDAAALFRYASDPAVGPVAGWPCHTSVEHSLEIIRTVFSSPDIYAVVLKSTGEAVGCCGITRPDGHAIQGATRGDGEIGYWIGSPYWGRGLIPEAVMAVLSECFRTSALGRVWCGYYEGNEKSRRVCEKCGFSYHHTERDVLTLLGDRRTVHYHLMTREQHEAMTGNPVKSRLYPIRALFSTI